MFVSVQTLSFLVCLAVKASKSQALLKLHTKEKFLS